MLLPTDTTLEQLMSLLEYFKKKKYYIHILFKKGEEILWKNY